jgi:L-methionine (R)-S-oxide reductase
MYKELQQEIENLVHNEENFIANASNFAAHIYSKMEDISWVGFYLLGPDNLIIGPFMGKPACIYLPQGLGVCWAAINKRDVEVVGNVQEYPNHIACDSEAKSEIAVPMIKNGIIYGVLDIDSYSFDRFSEDDAVNLKALVDLLVNASDLRAVGKYYKKGYSNL